MSVTTARRVAEQSVTAFQNLIGGKWQPASDGRTLDMISPSDGHAFASIARGTRDDVDAAVAAARRAFEEGAWGRMTAVERGRLMAKLGEAILVAPRGAGATRSARLRQADEAGACRYHRGGTLLRVLRRGRRQIPRRNHPVSRRLHGHGPARAEGRDRPYHSLELPGADVRPQPCARAGDGQRGSDEAGGRSLRGTAVPGATGAGCGFPRGSDQRGDRHRRRGRRGARQPSGNRFPVFHRFARSRHAGAEGGCGESHRLRAGTRRQVAADPVRGCRYRSRGAGGGERHRTERRADLLRGKPRAGPEVHLRQIRREDRDALRATCGSAATRWIWTAAR